MVTTDCCITTADGLPRRDTAFIRRTLRSGQRIKFDGNVLVLGDVNPGAEIIAAGSVVVMGALRGVVHAGASGDELATVVALTLLPTQIRIASCITRPPDGSARADSFFPEQASLRGGEVLIEKYEIAK